MAFNKYPPSMWYNEVLEVIETKELARQEEIRLIELFDSIENGYNILKGGNLGRLGLPGPNKGKKFSLEWRENLRKAQTGIKHTPERIEKNRQNRLGFKHTIETKEKLRQQKLGDKNPMYKRNFTKEHRENLRLASVNFWKRRKVVS